MFLAIARHLLETDQIDRDFMRRWVMKFMAGAKGAPTDTSKDHEYTDWAKLYAFLDEFTGSATEKVHAAS